jgi:hypothetical protein
MLCDTCSRYMSSSADSACSDGFRWRCFTTNAVIRCRLSLSIRDGSWFQQSNLTFLEIILLTYGVCREQTHLIQSEYRFSPHTVADWGMFCREAMLVYLERSSVKFGGPNKTVGKSIIGVTLLRVSGCLAVWSVSPDKLSCSRPGQNRRHNFGRYTWLDRTRHNGH